MLADHAELAQPGGTGVGAARGARARRGGRLTSRARCVAPVDCGTFLAARTERPFRRAARSFVSSGGLPLLAFLFPLSRNAAGLDQEDAAGLAAEHAFDNHLLEKRTVLEAAAACAEVTVDRCNLQMQLSPFSRLSPRVEAAQRLLQRSSGLPSSLASESSRLRCLPLSSAWRCRNGRSTPRRRRIPVLRVTRADSAAAGHGESTALTLRLPAVAVIRRSIQPDLSDTAFTLARAGPRPAAELAHNMT